MIYSIFLGFLLSATNTTVGYIISRIALKKNNKKFRSIIFGSMVIRYFAISVIVFLVLKFHEVNHLGFALSFLITTFVFIMLEIFYLNNRLNFLNLHDKLNK